MPNFLNFKLVFWFIKNNRCTRRLCLTGQESEFGKCKHPQKTCSYEQIITVYRADSSACFAQGCYQGKHRPVYYIKYLEAGHRPDSPRQFDNLIAAAQIPELQIFQKYLSGNGLDRQIRHLQRLKGSEPEDAVNLL